VSSTVALALNQWSHVVVTKSGATVKLYINAVDSTGAVVNATLADTTSALNIGRDVAFPAQYFNGRIDEVAVYPTALSAARVAAHYAAA
jgi:hypothetical protein